MTHADHRASPLGRRTLLKVLPAASLSLGPLAACRERVTPKGQVKSNSEAPGARAGAGSALALEAVLEVFPLGSPPWPTFDPFLFCVHHDDQYPVANAVMGPDASLAGRAIGNDFEGKDGWRMYHGDVVPGFPRHPHRGFETVTVTRRGYIDHSDSLGATARYGRGDVQWMTAGKGIVHAEMFPLLDRKRENPAELMQIWINLPRANKFANPYFSMFWQEHIPERVIESGPGVHSKLRVIAGQFEGSRAPRPPPDSWAARVDADVAIWTLEMTPRAALTLPRATSGANRTLYFYRGGALTVDAHSFTSGVGVRLNPDSPVTLVNGEQPSELLLLAGQPIAEPVVKSGPFVMNSATEIRQAYSDYRQTAFGGWPWSGNDPVHARDKGRFAVHADGRLERAPA